MIVPCLQTTSVTVVSSRFLVLLICNLVCTSQSHIICRWYVIVHTVGLSLILLMTRSYGQLEVE